MNYRASHIAVLLGVTVLHGAALFTLSRLAPPPVTAPTPPSLALVALPALGTPQATAAAPKPAPATKPTPPKPLQAKPKPVEQPVTLPLLKAMAKNTAAPEAPSTPSPAAPSKSSASEHSDSPQKAGPANGNSSDAPAREGPVTPPTQVGGYASTPRPNYPPLSVEMGEEGSVRIRAQIDADGRPSDVTVAKGSGFPRLDRAAVTAVKGWRFNPARRGNEAIPFTYTFSVDFTLRNAKS
ncbi:energy transducer TonB [Neisseriaceae bacterium JH1-16]|nr:energy transducer TonB [Neisseriaceae bacterium JH1-16]